MYLGEVARRIILTLAEDASLALFGTPAVAATGGQSGGGVVPAFLREPGTFSTAALSSVVEDGTLLGSKTAKIVCAAFKVSSLSLEARSVVRRTGASNLECRARM